MDLVDWSQETFDKIQADYLDFAGQLGIADVRFIPLSAIEGDMVVDRGDNLGWYDGPTLLEILESVPAGHVGKSEGFRFPVQYVSRPMTEEYHDFRGYMGRVESGEIAIGDAVQVLPSGLVTRVADIQICGQSLPIAVAEQSVTILLENEIDISRGDMIVKSEQAPQVAKQIDAMLCWLAETPLDRNRRYLVRHTTRETKAILNGIAYRLDINSLQQQSAERLNVNDIGRVSFKLAQPLCIDTYADNRATGAFIVIDEASNNTVGAGMILGC
jgi:sulfate adenylyltransferase subunit 1